MASGDLIVKVADKDTLDRTYANTNAILAAVGEDVRIKGVKRYGMKINKNDSNPATRCTYLFDAVGMTPAAMNYGSIIFLMGLAPNVLGYRHPAAILDRSKNKCCGLITDGEELKNNQLCFSVDTTVLHLFFDLSRTCPRTSGGWIPPLALMPKNNRSVLFLVA